MPIASENQNFELGFIHYIVPWELKKQTSSSVWMKNIIKFMLLHPVFVIKYETLA